MKLFLSAQSVFFHCAFITIYWLEHQRIQVIEHLLDLANLNIHLHDVEHNLIILLVFTSLSLFSWFLSSCLGHQFIKWSFLISNLMIGIFGILVVHKMRDIYVHFLNSKEQCNIIFHLANQHDLLTQLFVCQDLYMYTFYYMFYVYYMLPFVYYVIKCILCYPIPEFYGGYYLLVD